MIVIVNEHVIMATGFYCIGNYFHWLQKTISRSLGQYHSMSFAYRLLSAIHSLNFEVLCYNNNNNNNNNNLPASYIFQPIALETLGPMNSSAVEFFTVLGRKIGVSSAMTERDAFFFSGYPWLCSATTQFCCMKVSKESTIQIFQIFLFNFFTF